MEICVGSQPLVHKVLQGHFRKGSCSGACLQPCHDETQRLSMAHFPAGPHLLGLAGGTPRTDGETRINCSYACRTPWSTHGGEPSFSSSSRVTLLAPEQDLREAELTVKPLMVAYSNFEMELGCKFPFSSLQLVSWVANLESGA